MGSETEPAKLLLPFLQRADELQKHELLVAYYCRLYAMERGLKIPAKERTKTTNALLVSLMKQLEKDKKSLKLGPEDNLHIEGFALNVFAKADKQDRAERADLNTAKTFYAASIFFEILNQFGELQPDLEQKQKYAVWKAADIRKALKEGRRPEPGPPGGGEDLSIPSILPTSTQDVRNIETFPANHPIASIPSPTVDTNHDQKPSTNTPTSPSSYSKADYPSHGFQSPPSPPVPPPSNRPEQSYPQSYQPQQPSYSHDQNYPSHDDTSGYKYSNFQTYPSFNENNLPTAPGHYNYYQGSDAAYQSSSAYSHQSSPVVPDYASTVPYNYGDGSESVHPGSVYSNPSGPLTSKYSSTAPYNPGHVNDTHPGGVTPPPSQPFIYDVNYVPPPEKISEALKSAKLAVGALAFDEVGPAVDYLKRSLELLTKSSASH